MITLRFSHVVTKYNNDMLRRVAFLLTIFVLKETHKSTLFNQKIPPNKVNVLQNYVLPNP